MIAKVIKNSFKSLYLRQVLTLTAGTTLAQAIPIAIAPILTRLYSPEDFALLALYLAVASVLSVVATARYELAVILPASDRDGINIVALSIIIALLMSTISLVLVYLFKERVADALHNKELSEWLYFIPLSILATGTYRTLSCWTNRKVQYRRMAIAKVSQTVATGAVNTAGGIINATGSWLILGEIIGHSVGALMLAIKMRSDGCSLREVNQHAMLMNAKKYSDFPKINSLHALVDVLQSSGIIFVISALFGGLALGLYALTMRVLTAPVGVIGTSIAQVFYQKASRAYSDGNEVHSLLISTTKKLASLSIPFFIVLALIAPDFFALVFGEKWRGSGEYAQILTPWLALHFIVMPVTQIPMIYGRQKVAFLFGLTGNTIMLLTVMYGGYANNLRLGLILLSVGMVIYLPLYFWWILRLTKEHALTLKGSLQSGASI